MKHTVLRVLALALALLAAALPLVACGTEESFAFKTPAGAEISIGDSDKVISDLGRYLSKDESASCGGIPGNDCVYAYNGFRVKTTPAKDGGSEICQIELTDDSVKTPEGLYIGMSAEDAKGAMSGKGIYAESGASFNYTKGNCKLQIAVRDGKVSGITYLTA